MLNLGGLISMDLPLDIVEIHKLMNRRVIKIYSKDKNPGKNHNVLTARSGIPDTSYVFTDRESNFLFARTQKK